MQNDVYISSIIRKVVLAELAVKTSALSENGNV